jgi:hypothetical protein
VYKCRLPDEPTEKSKPGVNYLTPEDLKRDIERCNQIDLDKDFSLVKFKK